MRFIIKLVYFVLELDKLALQVKKVAHAKLVELTEDKGLVVGILSNLGGERRITVADMPKLYVVLVWSCCHIMLA